MLLTIIKHFLARYKADVIFDILNSVEDTQELLREKAKLDAASALEYSISGIVEAVANHQNDVLPGYGIIVDGS